MDVINILGPRKALKRSKPMPNFGLPANRPCSAGASLKRTSGQVNIPKLMSLSSSAASKLESDAKEQCIRLFCKKNPATAVYPVAITTPGNDTQIPKTETENRNKDALPPKSKSTTGPEEVKIPGNDASPSKSKIVPTLSGVSIKLSAASIGSYHSEGHQDGSADKLKLVVPPRRVDSRINAPLNPAPINNYENNSLQSITSVNSQNVNSQSMSLIKSTKTGNNALKNKPDNNAGGDSVMHMLPSMVSVESGKTTARKSKRLTTQPLSGSNTGSSKHEDSHSQVTKYNPSKKEETTECKEPQMIMANNGAIRFQLPGRVQHKTTIKLAHYPEKSGETVVINVPEGDMESYCEEECQNTPEQLAHKTIGLPALPPSQMGNNPCNDFPMNGPNGYQSQFYNTGSPITGQNFYYSQQQQQQQQYMQQNPSNNFHQQQFGFMNGMNGGPNGFNNNNNLFNYYSGPPPPPPPQNYQSYGYGYPL